MNRILTAFTSVALVMLASVSAAQTDELLIAVPSTRVSAVQREARGIRAYFVMGDTYVCGVSSNELTAISGVPFVVLDDHAWSRGYHLVTHMPGSRLESVSCSFQELLRVGDQSLLKGLACNESVLRDAGLSVVEVTRSAIAIPEVALTAPMPAVPHDAISSIIALVSDSMVAADVQGLQDFGTRYCTNANREQVFAWLQQRFQSKGVGDVAVDSFFQSSTWQKNIVATIPGAVNPAAEIIVGGHFDSYSSNLNLAPGADDNASGTSAALEMARVIVQSGYQPALTLRFIGFAAEEIGLRGSAIYAQRARQANRDIKAMLNYDMIGYRNQSSTDRDFYIVWYPGAETHSNLHAAMATAYTTLTPVMTTSYRSSSDSWSFYQQGYKSVFCIERDFSPYYHSPNDLLQYLDKPYMAEIVKAGLATLLILDMAPRPVDGLTVRDMGNGTSLFVQWPATTVADFAQYRIYVGHTPGVFDTSFYQTATSRIITGLTQGATSYIGVTVVDLVGREAPVIERSGVPLLVPRAPLGLGVRDSAMGVQLWWNRNSEVDLRGYNVYRTLDSTLVFVRANAMPLLDSMWVDTGMVHVPQYFYVTAIDSTGYESATSDTVVFGPVSVEPGDNRMPAAVRLHQNYPNPFNPVTTIEYELSMQTHVVLTVFDLLGREVAILVNEKQTPGRKSVQFSADGLASGMYLYRLEAAGSVQTRKMAVMR